MAITARNGCCYKNDRLPNKMVGTCGKDQRSTNPRKVLFKYNTAGRRDPGRPYKRYNINS
jgi:hypothetical protein